jgi:hypothetical protein
MGVLLRDDGILQVICPTCQNVFAESACQRPPGYFAWGCFRYFLCESRFGLAADLPSRSSRAAFAQVGFQVSFGVTAFTRFGKW